MVLLVLFFTFSNRVIFLKNSTTKSGISKLPALRDREFKGQSVKINQSVNLILKATNREAVRPAEAGHEGTGTAEEQVLRVGTIQATRPIVAAGAYIAERTSAVVAEACNGQLKRRGKGPSAIVAAPALAFCIPLGFRWQSVTAWARVVYTIHTLP